MRKLALLLFLFTIVLANESRAATFYYFLDDVSTWGLTVSGGPPNTALTYTFTQTTAGIVGFSTSSSGTFTSSLQLVVNTDGSGNGSGTYYVKGIAPGQTDVRGCETGGSCAPWNTLGIAVVSTVELITINSTIEDVGGEKRYYPDKQSPNDNTVRKKVRVRATLSLPAANFGVIFRSYDMDDPSSDASPVDSNDAGGVKTGGDNRAAANKSGIMSEVNQTGTSNTFTAISNGSGIAEADLWTTMHPGDNFMVAAAAFTSILDGLTVNTANGVTLKDSGGTVLPVDRAKASPLLTVWRKLHLEVDNMGAVGANGNSQSGTVSSAVHVGGQTDVSLSITPDAGRYNPGNIKIHNTNYDIVSYTGNTVRVNGNLNINQITNKAFKIWDDDDYDDPEGATDDDNPNSGDESESSIATLTALTNLTSSNVYAPAYITPVNDGGGNINNNGSATFELNTPNDSMTLLNKINAARQSSGGDEYWVGYLQVGYQGDSTLDFDPDSQFSGSQLAGTPQDQGNANTSDSVNSTCSNMPRGEVGSILFQESTRDFFNIVHQANPNISNDNLVAPHELGHQFGLRGDVFGVGWGIMGDVGIATFAPAHLHILRCRVHSPGLTQ